jgi:hypothetical protein
MALKKQVAGGAALALVLTTLCGSAASAAVITQTMTATVSLGGGAGLDFAGFNATLGTLTDVTASLSGDVTISATITNDTGEPQLVSGAASGMVEVSGPGNLSFTTSYSPTCASAVGADGTAACHDTTSYGPTSQSGIAPLTDFIGGSVVISLRDKSTTRFKITDVIPGPLDCCSIGAPTGTDDATVTLQYTYRPIPESSTWAMMLLGLAGIGFVGYRRTRRAKPQAA